MTLAAQPYAVLFEQPGRQPAQVTVCISLYNYQAYIGETLESVYRQTLDTLDLIVVDDGSTDRSVTIACSWLEHKRSRFNRVQFLQHRQNSGLAASRNTALSHVQTPFTFILDADNLIYPRCLGRCLEVLSATSAAFAYPLIAKFGDSQGIGGNLIWNRDRLAQENYIDAMAMLRQSAVAEVGGYSKMLYPGWEDYDLWCKFAELNYIGVLVPEILARYRVHHTSMLRSITNQRGNIEVVRAEMMRRHPWMKLDQVELA